MLNKQLLIGHVGEEPECGQTIEGNAYARFRIATTERSFTTSRGVQVPERTTWHNIECWGGLARVIKERLHKGDKVYVEGIHHTREYEKNGRRDVWHSCDVSYIEFLSAKKEESPTTAAVTPSPTPTPTPTPTTTTTAAPTPQQQSASDDLPWPK